MSIRVLLFSSLLVLQLEIFARGEADDLYLSKLKMHRGFKSEKQKRKQMPRMKRTLIKVNIKKKC